MRSCVVVVAVLGCSIALFTLLVSDGASVLSAEVRRDRTGGAAAVLVTWLSPDWTAISAVSGVSTGILHDGQQFPKVLKQNCLFK